MAVAASGRGLVSRIGIEQLTAARIENPGAIAAAAAARRRPASLLADHGRMMIVAADHPARGALGAGQRAAAMGDRRELLRRLCAALEHPGVNGVLATPDVIDDLLLLGALDDKVVIGSMNRGGLQKAAFELDDRFTAYRAPTLAAMGFEGGKMLLRVDLDDPATAPTLESAGTAVSELAAAGLMAMIEPFMAHRVEGRLQNVLTAPAMATVISIAAGLGDSSAHTWLKIPIVPEMERAVAATTLPCVVLGGEVSEDASAAYDNWRRALALPNVHGLVVGRAMLFPPDDDVAGAVRSAVELCASTRPGS